MTRGMITIMVVLILAIIGGFVVCDAVFDDEDEPGDLGAPTTSWLLAGSDYDRDGDDGSRNRNGNDCQDAEAECHDNDFSPQFDESPVTLIICVEEGSCQFG